MCARVRMCVLHGACLSVLPFDVPTGGNTAASTLDPPYQNSGDVSAPVAEQACCTDDNVIQYRPSCYSLSKLTSMVQIL